MSRFSLRCDTPDCFWYRSAKWQLVSQKNVSVDHGGWNRKAFWIHQRRRWCQSQVASIMSTQSHRWLTPCPHSVWIECRTIFWRSEYFLIYLIRTAAHFISRLQSTNQRACCFAHQFAPRIIFAELFNFISTHHFLNRVEDCVCSVPTSY